MRFTLREWRVSNASSTPLPIGIAMRFPASAYLRTSSRVRFARSDTRCAHVHASAAFSSESIAPAKRRRCRGNGHSISAGQIPQ